MTREDLFEAIGNLKDGELESHLENNIVGFPKKKVQTGRWIGLAASVVLIAAVALMVPRMFRGAGSSNSADYAAKRWGLMAHTGRPPTDRQRKRISLRHPVRSRW